MAPPRGIPVGHAFRVPERALGGANISRGRSVFDEAVRGPGAQVQEVPLRGGFQGAPPPQAPGQAVARPAIGQAPTAREQSEVERVIQREMPPVGVSREEARAIVTALGPALEASAKAVEEGVACGKVDSFMVQEVRVLKDFLERFAAVARAGERNDRLGAGDFSKIDEILACQVVYEQVSAAVKDRTTAFVVGGIVLGAVALAIFS